MTATADLVPSQAVLRARAQWTWNGAVRPPFADLPGPREESVWDYPRPPRIEPVSVHLLVALDGRTLADTRAGKRVLETSHPPTFYFPPGDVDTDAVLSLPNTTHCEWKGRSQSVVARPDGASRAREQVSATVIGWRIAEAYPEFADLRGWFAFYPAVVTANYDGVPVQPQPGVYYGGWVVPGLAGPFKGVPGSSGW
ncbi:MAG: DUF427 domain-containing protein [Pseudomonadota bacterium]